MPPPRVVSAEFAITLRFNSYATLEKVFLGIKGNTSGGGGSPHVLDHQVILTVLVLVLVSLSPSPRSTGRRLSAVSGWGAPETCVGLKHRRISLTIKKLDSCKLFRLQKFE